MALKKKAKISKKVSKKSKKEHEEVQPKEQEQKTVQPIEEQPVEEVKPEAPKSQPILNTTEGSRPMPEAPKPKPTPKTAAPKVPGAVNPINAEKDSATVSARVIQPVNSVIGRRRYTLEKGKVYKLSHNVYDVLKNAGRVL